jgi:hypothetical protein
LPEAYPAGTVVHEDLNAFADFVIARQKEQEQAQITAQEAAKSMARDKKAS